MVLAATLLASILCLLSTRVQQAARQRIQGFSSLCTAAVALAALFCAAAAWYGVLGWRLAGMIFAYVLVPVACAALRTQVTDLAAILALWLPLEFAAGAALVPRAVQGKLHAIAYGIAVTLALLVFLVYRRFEGMKYNFPRRLADFGYVLAGFVCAAAILIPLGLTIGFLGPAHAPAFRASTGALRVALIFAGTALPEEILFRALIQNWLMQRLGGSKATVALAGLIFGLSHLNNAPGPMPNWRYAAIATGAGFILGKVFQRSTSILASALVHTAVNTVKHFFF